MITHTPFEIDYLWLPLIGLAVGLVGSMIGGGGGFFFPPVLILFFQIPVHIAVATSLAATLPICLVGAIGHYRRGNLDPGTGMVFGVTGVLGAFAGATLAGLLTAGQLKTGFGIYSLLLGTFLIFNSEKKIRTASETDGPGFRRLIREVPKSTIYGFAGGIITGTFGTSGTAPVIAGLFAIRLPLNLIAGTSLMIIFINTFSALAGHLVLGEIDLTLVILLTAGTVAGAIAGPRFTSGLLMNSSEGLIRIAFACLVLLFGVTMIIT